MYHDVLMSCHEDCIMLYIIIMHCMLSHDVNDIMVLVVHILSSWYTVWMSLTLYGVSVCLGSHVGSWEWHSVGGGDLYHVCYVCKLVRAG